MASDTAAVSPSMPRQPTSAHRLIGMLNVSFAGVMLLCGVCGAAYMLITVATAPITEGYQKQMQEAMKAQQQQERDKKIAELKAKEDAAASEEEKKVIAAERQALEEKPVAEVPLADMMAVYRDPTLVSYFITENLTALVLNALLLASGIGLLAARRWARKLALWVAGLKIARLVLIYGFAITFVIPTFSKNMGDMMGKVMQNAPQQPGAPPIQMGQTVATVYAVMMTSGAVLMIILGAIYPAIMLWVLTRPAVKAACGEAPAPRPADPT